jgi:hypothetical protein
MRGLWRRCVGELQVFVDNREELYRRVRGGNPRRTQREPLTTKDTKVHKGNPTNRIAYRPRISPVPPTAQVMSFRLFFERSCWHTIRVNNARLRFRLVLHLKVKNQRSQRVFYL